MYLTTPSLLTPVDAGLKDKSGITRDEEHFKLTDGRFENYYKFSINTDEQDPGIDSIVATTSENSGANSDGDVIKVRFSERMIHYTLSGAVAGGISGNMKPKLRVLYRWSLTVVQLPTSCRQLLHHHYP